MNDFYSQLPFSLDNFSQETLLDYFQNAWELEDILMKSIQGEETFALNPDPLRNPLIFYLGHTPAFYLNKLLMVNLLEKGLNPRYEMLFGVGVDPANVDDFNTEISQIQWPKLAEVWSYRQQAYELIFNRVKNVTLTLPIHENHPFWALIMGIEHQRIHIETSSMLIRQLPLDQVQRPQGWKYAPTYGEIGTDKMIEVSGGIVELGKPENCPVYGWDCDTGYRQVEVKPFSASQSMITNGQFLEFVNAGGYKKQDYWDAESWQWKLKNGVKYPKFWLVHDGNYQYRAMFDKMDLPLDWPVEVNHYEAMAYCRWKGEGIRLMTEAEWNLATLGIPRPKNGVAPETVQDYNLNLTWGSPSPVGLLKTAESPSGFYDLRGNVWEWLGDNFNPLSGFKTHFLYENNSAPYFDDQHKMMLGGSWITNGTEALNFYRNWFRPYFYQHAGFRLVQELN